MTRRVRIHVRGAVQGVGFRPFVYGLATRLGLAGFVLNEPEGVTIELEGDGSRIDAFLDELRSSPPRIARVQDVTTEEAEPTGETGFVIRRSEATGQRAVLIAPDVATCDDCLREMNDPDDMRYRYPFINCTNCGPRYTIIRDMPYDRAQTTMAAFEMCPTCRTEYENPTNRRFHAEPTCCPACGPRVWLADADGQRIPCDDPVADAVRRLAAGQIVAVKGLGGFHLACDASNPDAVRLLRKRKARDLKPFASMVRDLDAVGEICLLRDDRDCRVARGLAPRNDERVDCGVVSNDDRLKAELRTVVLSGPERPILLLNKRADHGLADEVAPRSPTFGMMLPYTPLHHLLLEGPYPALVMTSGNISDEPIAHTNEDALRRLSDLADAFLLHDRDIHIRTDDSVARIIAGQVRFLRRSRGYAPFPVSLPVEPVGRAILAVGPELNSTVCVTRGNQAFLSHHIGDLENVPAYEAFLQAIDHLESVLDVEPRAVAADLHPDYLSTRYARESGLPIIQVQHHHAHIASVLAETGYTDKVIGVSYDGMGWGTDGKPWGGEFLVCDLADFERAAHLEPVAQPGGDAAAKQPPRMAYAFLRAAFGDDADRIAQDLLPTFTAEERVVVARIIERDLNSPHTSSMGRLFDAASALLGICQANTFHAQAPMELESAAWLAATEEGFYSVPIEPDNAGVCIARTAALVRALVDDVTSGTAREVCAARFHNTVARLTLEICARIRDNRGLATVALSGGVFANAFLVERLVPILEKDGFEVLLNAEVPPGDGGVCLGQAAVAASRLARQ
jgi:hydrogenase maturation protein HypF